MSRYNVAILGATGAVGEELLGLLHERDFPIDNLRLLASARSAGKKIPYANGELAVEEVGPDSFRDVDLAFFSAGGSISRQWVSHAVESGALVIDNTSAFRLDPIVPLVVPEVNGRVCFDHQGIIANPNCSTIIMVVALAPIHREAKIKRVVVSTYQAVSGAGVAGMQELEDQVAAHVKGEPIQAKYLPVSSLPKHHQIAFNVIPHIDVFDELDYTREEWKMVHETRKIFGEETMAISPTTVRVPVFRSHAESINIETELPISVERVKEVLREADGVIVQDNPREMEYPMPLHTSGKDEVFVGRIRKDPTIPNGINLWVVGDQIRKGAALNAVQIAEYAHENGLIRR